MDGLPQPTEQDLARIRQAFRLLASHPVVVIGLTAAELPWWQCTGHGGVWAGRWVWSAS